MYRPHPLADSRVFTRRHAAKVKPDNRVLPNGGVRVVRATGDEIRARIAATSKRGGFAW